MTTSRRRWLKGAATICGSALLPFHTFAQPDNLEKSGRDLRQFFLGIVPSLLRIPEGPLAYPSVAISPPGKNYSTELWDWDTLWTIQGLLKLASLPEAASLRASILKHAQGSLMNFLSHQAPDDRIPIMISVSNKDPFHSAGSQHPNPSNQPSPYLRKWR